MTGFTHLEARDGSASDLTDLSPLDYVDEGQWQ